MVYLKADDDGLSIQIEDENTVKIIHQLSSLTAEVAKKMIEIDPELEKLMIYAIGVAMLEAKGLFPDDDGMHVDMVSNYIELMGKEIA